MRLYISSVVSALLLLGFPFIMTEVVQSFSKCSQFFFNEQPPAMAASCTGGQNNYKMICQRYKNSYRFATYYDTTNKIPVYTAYKYTGTGDIRLDSQGIFPMIEPQLDPSNDEMGREYENQATKGDFQNISPVYLISSSYAADRETAESTFTLTNSVLLNTASHGNIWNNMVNEHKEFMDSNCRDKQNKRNVLAYVLAGALPDSTKEAWMKIKAPSHMWTAFCCYDSNRKSWVSQAQWAINEETDLKKSIGELKDLLKKEFNADIQLFDNDCKEPQQSGRPRGWNMLNCCNCVKRSRNNG